MTICRHRWMGKRLVVDPSHTATKPAVWMQDVQRHLPPRHVVDVAAGTIAVSRNSYMFGKYRQNAKLDLLTHGYTHELNNRGQQ